MRVRAQSYHDIERIIEFDFIRATGVDCFAPAIGNAHGQYKQAPTLNAQRVTDLVEATGIPMALHGGTGLSDAQFTDLIARGCGLGFFQHAGKAFFVECRVISSAQEAVAAEDERRWKSRKVSVRRVPDVASQLARGRIVLTSEIAYPSDLLGLGRRRYPF